jgi:hypothetical protein
VRSGIIRPPAAGALEPLLMRLLQLDPATRPDAATARELLEQFATQLHAPLRLPARSRWRGWWWRGRRVLIAAVAVAMAAAVAVGAIVWGRGGDQAYAGVPALPSAVDPIALTGDPRAVDPCSLIDLRWLRQFGQPFMTVTGYLPVCRARIATTKGDVWLEVKFAAPVSSLAEFRGDRTEQLGDLTIVRQGTSQGSFKQRCRNVLVLADRTLINIFAYGAAPDLCKIAEVGTVNAVNQLAQHGISYQPGRASRWSIARSDACTVLDPIARSKIPNLNSTIRYPGFANWSCTWGPDIKGSPQVVLSFRIDPAAVESYGVPTTIAGHRAWLHTLAGDNNPQQCNAYVVHRLASSATSVTEMIEVDVDAPESPADLCSHATELATAVETALPPS